MKLVRLLCVLCVLCALCGSVFGALDRAAFTFTRYDLEVRVDPQGHAIAARGKIRLRNDSASPQDALALQISSSLEWRLIHVNGNDVEYVTDKYTTDMDHTGAVEEAAVRLPAPVPPKGEIELEVGYSGTIEPSAERLTRMGVPAATAAHTDWDAVAEPITAVRGLGYVTWYPVSLPAVHLSQPDYFAALRDWQDSQRGTSMRVNLCWVSEDENVSVVANGVLEGVRRGIAGATEEATTNTGCSLYTYARVGATVPTFAIAPYTQLARPALTVYHLSDQQGGAQAYALAGEKVLPFESGWFGAPHAKVQVVQLPDAADAPFESGAMLFTPLDASDPKQVELRMMHQFVHASFTSPRPWIEEGLAHFGMALYREQQETRHGAIEYMDSFLPALQAAEAGVAREPATQQAPGLITTADEVMYRIKAMFVWWMLRDMVGDAALQRALKAYRPADDTSPAYMPQLINKEAHRDLEWFFDDWVYRDRGLPDFRVASAFPRKTLSNLWVVTVTVENTGGAGAEVPAYVETAMGEKSRRMVVKAKAQGVERIEVPAAPTEAVVNDGSVPEANMSNNSLPIKQ
jgi:hypothetical protein